NPRHTSFIVGRSKPSSSGTSNPAENIPGTPERTTARAPLDGAVSILFRNSVINSGDSAFAGGRSIRSSSTAPCSILPIIFVCGSLLDLGVLQFCLQKHDAYRRRRFQFLSHWRQSSRAGINAKDHDVARLLVRNQYKLARGIDGEVAQCLALWWRILR